MVILNLIYTVYFATLIVASFILHFFICTPLLLFPTKLKQKICYNLAIPFLKVSFALAGISLSIQGEERIPKDENVIFFSNHQSLLDIIVLMTLIPKKITFFAKRELKKVPILSQDISNMGHVFVDRNQSKKASEQLRLIEQKLHENHNIIIFPEGTRSSDGELLPFKRGAFLLAANTQKTLIPCYIRGTGKVLKKKSFWVKPGNIQICIGEPIVTRNEDEKDPKKLSRQMQEKGFNQMSLLKKEND
ncbi:hypothetical protein DID78_03350 [Candidatus Marinamargulisbacteria bacterium SCGC AG-343-D04]|nr:hypothetical protein DID78_03350 [Candidatus Marinamargulisbacteria bacterium SCGC AG-343-D04]